MALDFVKTGCKCILSRCTVLFHNLRINIACNSYDLLERENNIRFTDLLLSHHHFTVFDSAGGLNNHMLFLIHGVLDRVKVIDLARLLEADTDDIIQGLALL